VTRSGNPSVPDVLRAVGAGALLGLLPEQEARMLAGPVARARAGVPFTTEDETAAARLLQSVREVLGPPLETRGIQIPSAPSPVSPPATGTGQALAPVLWMLASGYIAVRTPYALRDLMLTLPGRDFRATPTHGSAWHFPATPSAAVAVLAALEPYGPRASAGVLALAEQHAAVAAARAVLDEDTEVPEYDGTGHVNMPLWTHQRRFVQFGEESPAICFAVKMGAGKTPAAIALANKVAAARILIVCPDKVRRVWVREVRERSSVVWHMEDGTRSKSRGRGRMNLSHADRVQQANRTLFDCDCGAPVHAYVLNYEALEVALWQRWVPPAQLDLIIYDEAHKLKSHLEKHRRKVKGITKEELRKRAAKDLPRWTRSGIAGQWRAYTRRAIALTGTPFAQHPWDIFGVYRAIDPGIFGSAWTPFTEKYLEMSRDGTFPKRVRPEMLAEFAEKCMSIMYLPKVDLDLPGYSDVLRTVVLEPEARRIYDQMDTELWADLTRMLARQRAVRDGTPVGEGEGAPAELTAKNILSRLLRLQQLTGGTLRTDPVAGRDGHPVPGPEVVVSTVKAELLADVLEEIGCIASTRDSAPDYVPEPVVVFARFTPDLAAVRQVVEAAGLRYGEISGGRADGLDDDARMAGDRDVVGVQVQAGGTGVDLTRARYGVWYSLGYSVSDYDQARARLYRPGQTRPVVYIHFQAEDTPTADEGVYAAIGSRRDAVSAVLRAGGVEPELVGVIEEDPGPVMLEEVDTGGEGAAVALPWD